VATEGWTLKAGERIRLLSAVQLLCYKVVDCVVSEGLLELKLRKCVEFASTCTTSVSYELLLLSIVNNMHRLNLQLLSIRADNTLLHVILC